MHNTSEIDLGGKKEISEAKQVVIFGRKTNKINLSELEFFLFEYRFCNIWYSFVICFALLNKLYSNVTAIHAQMRYYIDAWYIY